MVMPSNISPSHQQLVYPLSQPQQQAHSPQHQRKRPPDVHHSPAGSSEFHEPEQQHEAVATSTIPGSPQDQGIFGKLHPSSSCKKPRLQEYHSSHAAADAADTSVEAGELAATSAAGAAAVVTGVQEGCKREQPKAMQKLFLTQHSTFPFDVPPDRPTAPPTGGLYADGGSGAALQQPSVPVSPGPGVIIANASQGGAGVAMKTSASKTPPQQPLAAMFKQLLEALAPSSPSSRQGLGCGQHHPTHPIPSALTLPKVLGSAQMHDLGINRPAAAAAGSEEQQQQQSSMAEGEEGVMGSKSGLLRLLELYQTSQGLLNELGLDLEGPYGQEWWVASNPAALATADNAREGSLLLTAIQSFNGMVESTHTELLPAAAAARCTRLEATKRRASLERLAVSSPTPTPLADGSHLSSSSSAAAPALQAWQHTLNSTPVAQTAAAAAGLERRCSVSLDEPSAAAPGCSSSASIAGERSSSSSSSSATQLWESGEEKLGMLDSMIAPALAATVMLSDIAKQQQSFQKLLSSSLQARSAGCSMAVADLYLIALEAQTTALTEAISVYNEEIDLMARSSRGMKMAARIPTGKFKSVRDLCSLLVFLVTCLT